MDELISAPSTTALDVSIRQRPNQWLQGVLSFFAVIGVGSAITLAMFPPVRLRVITVEKHNPPVVVYASAPTRPQPTRPEPAARPLVDGATPRTPKRPTAPKPPAPMLPLLTSDDCHDPLCGLSDLKR